MIRDAEIESIIPCFRPGARILEIGAGTGQQALEISRRGFSVEAIEIASSGYRQMRIFSVTEYDGRRIPFPDASFDFVFSSNVLEHVIDLSTLNLEIRRVLRPDGLGVHVLPTHTWRFWTTLTLFPAGVQYVLPMQRQTRPQSAVAIKQSKSLLEKLRGHFGRHGEHGTLLSEHWLFHPNRWRRAFHADGFEIIEERPIGIAYTGNMIFGTNLSIAQRRALARFFGSSTIIYIVKPTP
jgi:ubiquinone/menaquinone biosynthesis C-methylase UbiE